MLLSRRNQESRTSIILAAVSLLVALVASSATGCSADGEETPPPGGGVGGFYPGTGGTTPGTGGNVPPPPPTGGTTPGTGGITQGTGGIVVGTGGEGGAGGGPQGTGGEFVGGTGGIDPGTGGADPGTGGAGPPPKGNPVIPADPGDCPEFRSGTITYKNLGGITVAAGAKAPGPTAPMLIYWHGTLSNSGEYAGMAAPVAQGIQSQGGILISFQGTTGGDLLSGTNIFGKGDLNLVDGLVACAVKNHNIDPRRIFTMGCSAGGLMSAATATLRSNYIAAAAPNSGGYTVAPAWQSAATPALMTVHGKAGSDVVVIDFSQSSNTADKAFKAHGSFVINCDHGKGHCAGSGQAPSVWKFFQAHPFGTSPSPWAGGLPSGFDPVCKIFAG